MKTVVVQNLTKDFKGFIAVNKINFEIEKGEIFGFLGPNGAGKTTTIRMLCGILKPTSGKGFVAGLDIFEENEKIKKKVGYMSQKFSLYPDLTVAENIDFFSGIYGVSGKDIEKRKEWALKTAGLIECQRRITRQLPGGFKQRLALVCALLHNPQILFLDEPTAGMDPLSRRGFWELIYHLKSEDETTIFVTTHYMDEAEHCERIALIQDGKISVIGSPAELKGSLRLKVFIIQGEIFYPIKKRLEKEMGVKNVVPFGRSLHVFFADEGDAYMLKDKFEKSGIKFLRFEPVQPSLEDVFISVTER